MEVRNNNTNDMQQGKEEAARSLKPEEQRNERLAATLIKQLNRRHMEAYYCATATEAVSQVSALIADGSSVTWGGTMTVRDLGIPEALRSRGTLQVLDRDLAVTPEEKPTGSRPRRTAKSTQAARTIVVESFSIRVEAFLWKWRSAVSAQT